QYMRFGDFNGDGKTDYMWIPYDGDGRWRSEERRVGKESNGLAFTLPSYSSTALPNLFDGVHLSYHSQDEEMQFGDVDGDGKTDYMWMPANGDGRWVIAYGTDNGFSTPSYDNPALPATISGGYHTWHGSAQYMRIGDFNGDGKTDYMWIPYDGDGRW